MKYIVSCPVLQAQGWQRFTVDAESEEEAEEVFRKYGGQFLDEEIEVTDIGRPYEVEVYGEEVPDE